MEDMTDLIVLTDDEGNEVEVEIVTRLEIEEVEYFIVSPVDSDEEDPVFTALKVVYDEEGTEFFETVDDDVEIAMIEEAYSVIFDEDGLN
ncbi:DUF1292 domain-containing protein [Proteiniclasticum sp.]|jgi:uncharacterized protein YrzB (UPF0473 family)|uniref:DUF1292 domain-containing protein n=1 Tax=Proteiniclasticum sp. TaxID=2053595 RepID=UPI000EEF95BA|nr:DUF1292 domain-containing protein [Proteiniclasticum sp.]HCW74803.1 hypothetical protein [Clostridiaceae bacterium]